MALVMLALAAAAGCAGVAVYVATTTAESVNEVTAWVEQVGSISDLGEPLITLRGVQAQDAAARLPGVVLPDDARDLMFARQGGSNATYWLRFTAPAASMTDAIGSMCFGALDAGVRPTFAYDSDPDIVMLLDWWTRDAAESFSGGTCSPQPNVTFRALADTSADANVTVYLEISTQ